MPMLMCPNCNVTMNQVRRKEVELDMCPTCRGVWLDRGELEKILENERLVLEDADRGSAESQRRPQQWEPPPGKHDRGGGHGGHGDRYGSEHGGEGRRRRRGFDLFDLFD